MSIFALMPAVRDRIRTTCGLLRDECRVIPGGKPPPVCGEKFVAIHAAEWTPGDFDLNQGIDEYYGVSVTLSFRTAFLQFDDQGEEAYIKAGVGIEALARKIIGNIHQSVEVMTAANLRLSSDPNKIIEYLRWSGGDPEPSTVGPEWFGGKSLFPKEENVNEIAGLVLQVNFTKARRTQTLTNFK